MSEIGQVDKKIAFVVLIGGKSSRFGTDKGIFEFKGKPLLSYQLETLSKFDKSIFLVAHSKKQVQNYIEKIDITKITAFILDNKNLASDSKIHSPMIGIHSAFEEIKTLGYEKAFVLSCDTPLIDYNVVDLLIKESNNNECCIPQWENTFLEPLFAIYPIEKTLRQTMKSLRNSSFRLTNLLNNDWKINYISVEKSILPLDKDLLTFINVNGPVDIKKLMKVYIGPTN